MFDLLRLELLECIFLSDTPTYLTNGNINYLFDLLNFGGDCEHLIYFGGELDTWTETDKLINSY